MKVIRNTKGFTMVEVVVVIGVVALLAGVLVPLISKNLEDAKRARAKNEAVVIAAAIGSLYKDTGLWPSTNKDGPSGAIDRLASNVQKVPKGKGTSAGPGAARWGNFGTVKPFSDFLYYNNPDNDTGANNQNQANADYPTSGEFKWSGPYLEKADLVDPWGSAYVVNARYFPANSRFRGTNKHRVYVLSAGANRVWETPFNDSTGDGKDKVMGDDIGVVITVR